MMSNYGERRHERRGADAHDGAAMLQEQARKYIRKMNTAINLNPHEPWSEEVKQMRENARCLFVAVCFNFPSSPLAQNFHDLWLTTSHTYLKAITAEANYAKDELITWNQRNHGRRAMMESRLWNAWRQHMRIIKDDTEFYKKLIDRVVRFYDLRPHVEHALEHLDIFLGHGAGEDGQAPAGLTEAERKSKSTIVHELLTYLGDLERYSCAMNEDDPAVPQDPESGGAVERSYKAVDYYQAAATLMPDDGHAYNSLAIIYTSEQQDLKAHYYRIRSYAARYEFWSADANIQKRSHERVSRGSDPSPEDREAIIAVMLYLDSMALINCQSRLTEVTHLIDRGAALLSRALTERLISSDDLVKLTICLIGTHFRARQLSNLKHQEIGGARQEIYKETHRTARQYVKEAAVDALSVHIRMLCDLGTKELMNHDESVIIFADDNEGEANADLARQLSPVLRRMLPSLRILSKWLKCNIEYLRRHADRSRLGDLSALWAKYAHFITKIAEMFPIYKLPSLMGCLEEDIELRGFSPLSRTSTDAKRFEAANSDEEQLMRISDLSVEAVLIVQQAVDLQFLDEDAIVKLHELHRQPESLTEWQEVSVVLASKAPDANVKPANHGRNTSQNTDDDDEEIVYTPPRARCTAQQGTSLAASAPEAVTAVTAPVTAPALESTAFERVSETVPTPAHVIESSPVSAPAAAPASAPSVAPQRAITAMDLVEQIGRRFQRPVATPLDPPLPIVPSPARKVGVQPANIALHGRVSAGPPPGFAKRPAGNAGPPPGIPMPVAAGSQVPHVGRHPGLPPGFAPRISTTLPTKTPPEFVVFPSHVPATQGLFGATATKWTLSREESQEGIRRSLSQIGQARPEASGSNAPVPRAQSGSSLVGQDILRYPNLSMSRAVSQPSQSRSQEPRPPAPIRPTRLWPRDHRDDVYLMAGRVPPDHY